jgi:hypothetical protein
MHRINNPLALYRVLLLLLCSGLFSTRAVAQVYFDINKGGTGSGVANASYDWNAGTGANSSWTGDSTGNTSGGGAGAFATWASGSNAIFSAGIDAAGVTFQVTVNTATTAGSVTVQEGTTNFKAAANFTINTASNLSGSALTLAGGTLTLGGTGSYSFGSLYVTGSSILDFGSAVTGGTTLTFGSIYIANGASLAVRNWTSGTDVFTATSVFSGGSVTDAISPSYSGTIALSAGSSVTGVTLSASNAAGATAYWNGSSLGFATTPIPEPSTYGAMLMAGCAGLFGLRRWRAKRRAVRG